LTGDARLATLEIDGQREEVLVKQWELRGVTGGRPAVAPMRAPDVGDPRAIRALVDQLPAVFWTTDRSLRFTSCLGSGLSDVGLGPNQVVGTSLPELFDDDGPRPAVVEAHHEALRGRSVPFELDLDGRSYRAMVAPLTDGSGSPIGTIGIALRDEAEHEAGDVEAGVPWVTPDAAGRGSRRRWRSRSVRGRAGDAGRKAG
jgi:PAS domain-containing protein